MQAGQVVSSGIVGGADNSWQIAGAGDFNRDGTSDVLWHSSNGAGSNETPGF
jgi:hypothetical protein